MPAKNPVIAVVVPPNVHATIRRLAGLRGTSRSAVVREFLIETEPVLARLANLLDVAARSDKNALKQWAATLAEAQTGAEASATDALAVMDQLQASLPLTKPGRPVAGTERRPSAAGRARAVPRKPARRKPS